ncbi:MAG: hypothetical protein ACOY30_02940 [Bacillota bacterium]
MKKTLILAVISVLVAITLVGCSLLASAKNKGDDKKTTQSTGGGASVNEGQKNSGDTSGGKDSSGKAEENSSIRRDSGRYVGQIDNNFIEIKISGVPDNIAARSFMLGDKLKEQFSKLGLKKDDQVGFTYMENDKNQMVIMEIKKL